MKIRLIKYYVLLLMCAVTLYNCTDVPEGLITDYAPETHLTLYPDSIISPQVTRIKITWWGDDPDGLIAGYRFSFDSTNWTYSEGNDSTFQLVIVGNDSTFRFWVAAVDDKGNIDPTPATNLYPVFNSPPKVSFNAGTGISDTSFPVATFAWTGTDPDGDNSISKYYYALNDTSNWNELNSTVSTITLKQVNGIVPGQNNKLYLKAKDIAGIYSPVVTMPDSNRTWYVRPVIGRVLLINDYFRTAPTDVNQAVQFYQSAMDTISYSKLDIKVNSGGNIPRIVNPMFIETLKLFQAVIWFANRGNNTSDIANFDLAQQTLPFYIASGGKVFFTTGFPDAITSQGSIVNFAPVDSLTAFQFTSLPLQTQTISFDNSYPVLESGSPSPDRVRGIKFRFGTPIICKLPISTPYDTSQVTICIKDFSTNPKIVFMSVPLNRMNFSGTGADFLKRVLSDFGIN